MHTASINHAHAPAHLIIGNKQQTLQYTIDLLQKQLCPTGGCNSCVDCLKIANKQHHQVLWLAPEPTYTLQTLEPLFETIVCANDNQQHFFFIVPQSDFLTQACANRLLKIVEEPPPGYQFIFLAQRPAQVIATIRSRCLAHTLATQHPEPSQSSHPLFALFSTGPLDPITLLVILEKNTPSEIESVELIDALLAYWSQRINHDIHANQVVTHLQQALLNPPMPGSSKIFWRNVFMRLNQATCVSTTPLSLQSKMAAKTY